MSIKNEGSTTAEKINSDLIVTHPLQCTNFITPLLAIDSYRHKVSETSKKQRNIQLQTVRTMQKALSNQPYVLILLQQDSPNIRKLT